MCNMIKTKIKYMLAEHIKRKPRYITQIRELARYISPENTVLLDYSVHPKPRWNYTNPHPELYKLIDEKRDCYKDYICQFLGYIPLLEKINNSVQQVHPNEPSWINGWMPALDGVALYCFIAIYKPTLYIEIGSGSSTRFARKAIKDQQLSTKIVSIDPNPRADIDRICDHVLRVPLEDVDQSLFQDLGRNDILYIDNSHRSFMNSDVTVTFLEILPRLHPGVLVQIHDIALPYDYSEDWIDRYYSEQYLLACYMLGGMKTCDVIFPSSFISHDVELKEMLTPIWDNPNMEDAEHHGGSFWIKMK